MRTALLILLAANGIFFLWSFYVNAPAQQRDTVLPALQGEQIVLLSELRHEDVALDESSKQCLTLGPVLEKEQAEDIKNRLVGLNIDSRIRPLTQEETVGYWVYLPSHNSRSEAQASVNRLADLGVTDYFIVSKKPDQFAVSLGLFRELDHAFNRETHISNLGFDPKIRLRTKEKVFYWMDLSLEKNQTIPADLALDVSEMQTVQRQCTS